jgi:hypothetical protein
MLDIVHDHLDKVLGLYTLGSHFEDLKSAKEKYFSITGKLDEDKEEFESRMNCFNDWYIFQFRHNDGSKVIEDYIRTNQLEVELSQALLNVTILFLNIQKLISENKSFFTISFTMKKLF